MPKPKQRSNENLGEYHKRLDAWGTKQAKKATAKKATAKKKTTKSKSPDADRRMSHLEGSIGIIFSFLYDIIQHQNQLIYELAPQLDKETAHALFKRQSATRAQVFEIQMSEPLRPYAAKMQELRAEFPEISEASRVRHMPGLPDRAFT